MDATAQLAQKKIGRGISAQSEVDVETVLKRIGLDVHLLDANAHANPDVVVAADHVERVGNREDVGPALEGCESTIAQRPVVVHERRTHAATDAVLCRLGTTRREPPGHLLLRLAPGIPMLAACASAVSEGENVIENPVKAKRELVDVAIREIVGLRQSHVAAMVGDVLCAAKRIGFSEPGRASRNE